MKAGAGLIWIASYPKSGNTWVRMILASLLSGGATPEFRGFGQHCPNGARLRFLEDRLDVDAEELAPAQLSAFRAEAYRCAAVDGFRFIKVHDRHRGDLFPREATGGAVYIVRDPRDVAVSWADHINIDVDTSIVQMATEDFTLYPAGGRFYSQATQTFGSWSQNVRSWLECPPWPLLLLRYEDLLTDPTEHIARLARFVGLPDDPRIVTDTAQACVFASLQAQERQHGFREKLPHQRAFFRQGRAGAWRQSLTTAQVHELSARHGDVMLALGYAHDMPQRGTAPSARS